ncbi:MAG: ABC transporter permease [Pigmentiphaga sp.]
MRRNLLLAGLALVLGLLSVYPLAMLFYGSVHSTPPGVAGHFTLEGYRAVLDPENREVVWNTVSLAAVKTVLSIILAVLLAWIVARTDTPGRRTWEVLITLPFFIPPILTATAWGMLGNPQVGAINLLWFWLTGAETPLINMFSYGGVVWHMMQYSVPFIFLFVLSAFRAMDPSLEEASRMAGATSWQTFRKVTLVLMLPVLSSAAILSFIKGIETFESPIFFGTPAGIEVLTTRIYHLIHHQAQPDYPAATALSFCTMALMFLLVMGQWRLLGTKSFTTVTGKGFSPSVIKLGRMKWVTFAICAVFFILTVVLPVGQLFVSSFFQYFGFYQWDMLTLDHYISVWNNREFWRALGNTLWLGVWGATLTIILGALVAYVVVRTRWPGRRLIEALAWLPWLMPGIVLGVGFLWGFSILPHWIPIYGTMWALLLAYVALGTPVAVRVMTATFTQLSADLEESSRVHGATWLQTFRRIVCALAWPAFVVAWIIVFFGLVRELSASILLYSSSTEVLSVLILRMWSGGRPEEVSVIGLMMLLLVIVFRLVQHVLVSRRTLDLS